MRKLEPGEKRMQMQVQLAQNELEREKVASQADRGNGSRCGLFPHQAERVPSFDEKDVDGYFDFFEKTAA